MVLLKFFFWVFDNEFLITNPEIWLFQIPKIWKKKIPILMRHQDEPEAVNFKLSLTITILIIKLYHRSLWLTIAATKFGG